MPSKVEVGTHVPHFEMTDSSGKKISPKLFEGHPFVLYFYPKDETPGCTAEACDFRDLKESFNQLNIPIIGVSPDSNDSHNTFIAKHELNFSLISDPDHHLSSLFNVWEEKTVFGKKTWGIKRATFLVNSKGVICWIEKPVQVKQHAERVLQALASIR